MACLVCNVWTAKAYILLFQFRISHMKSKLTRIWTMTMEISRIGQVLSSYVVHFSIWSSIINFLLNLPWSSFRLNVLRHSVFHKKTSLLLICIAHNSRKFTWRWTIVCSRTVLRKAGVFGSEWVFGTTDNVHRLNSSINCLYWFSISSLSDTTVTVKHKII